MSPSALTDLICALSAQVHVTHAAVLAGNTHVPYDDSVAVVVAEAPAHLHGQEPLLARVTETYRMVVMGLASLQGQAPAPAHERRAVAYCIACFDELLGQLTTALVKDALTQVPGRALRT